MFKMIHCRRLRSKPFLNLPGAALNITALLLAAVIVLAACSPPTSQCGTGKPSKSKPAGKTSPPSKHSPVTPKKHGSGPPKKPGSAPPGRFDPGPPKKPGSAPTGRFDPDPPKKPGSAPTGRFDPDPGPAPTPPVLKFTAPKVFRTMMFSEIRKVPQTYKNVLHADGKPAGDGITYSITAPANYASKKISINPRTGELTFENVPVVATVQARHTLGSTADYTFTVTDHFSKRYGHSSVVVASGSHSGIYVIGGNAAGRPRNDVWKSTDGGVYWTEVTSTGTKFSARFGHSSVAVGSDIYVIGGNAGGNLNDVWKSSDGGVTWSEVSPGTRFFTRSYHASVVVGSDIYVIGGNGAGRPRNDVWKSTDSGENWSKVTSTATSGFRFSARFNFGSAAVGSDIYVTGGSTTDPDAGNVVISDVWKSTDGGENWTEVTTTGTKFSARYGHSSVVLGSDIYVIGGSGGITRLDDVWKWNSAATGGTAANWMKVTRASSTKFSVRAGHSSVVRGSDIYVIGGMVDGIGHVNDIWKSTDGGVNWVNVHASP